MRSTAAPTEDREAWVLLFDRGLREVYGYLLHRCGDPSLAQDLASDTFLAAARAAHSSPTTTPTTAWLITIARNKLIDHWRRSAIEERSLRAIVELDADRGRDSWDADPDDGPAMRVLHDLSPQHRAVLTLRYIDGLSAAETALLMQRTLQATETLIARAKVQFRQRYDEVREEGGHV